MTSVMSLTSARASHFGRRLAAGGIHAHVERRIVAKLNPLPIVDLGRRHPHVKQHSVGRRQADLSGTCGEVRRKPENQAETGIVDSLAGGDGHGSRSNARRPAGRQERGSPGCGRPPKGRVDVGAFGFIARASTAASSRTVTWAVSRWSQHQTSRATRRQFAGQRLRGEVVLLLPAGLAQISKWEPMPTRKTVFPTGRSRAQFGGDQTGARRNRVLRCGHYPPSPA